MAKRKVAHLKLALGSLMSEVFRTDCKVVRGRCGPDGGAGRWEGKTIPGLLPHFYKSYLQRTHLFNTYSGPGAE